MLNLHAHFVARAAFCIALLAGNGALAQADRWYRVELVVFSHKSVQTAEQWQPTPDLAYPNAARFLVDPTRIHDAHKQYRTDSTLDDFGRQIFAAPADPTSLEPQAMGEGHESGDGALTAMPRLPTPFSILPTAQLEFRGKAAYMQRSGRYRILFHETWVQPMADQSRALPIVLDRSGDAGQWPGLQGSITLYLSRYLHLETNLWLNTPGDYLPGTWRMPAPPLGPPSLIVEELPQPEAQTVIEEQAGDEQQLPPSVAGQEDQLAFGEELGPIYPYRHAVLLQQKRRMRSTEVHYIDHPMLGVITKLTPLTPDELETMARAEVDAGKIPRR